ncbi:MAG TPA: carbohydrate ABC transporter permease [Tepidisphaeraceae bacterium]|jgi:multiple sugar transport system permease protein|nr:carbohydrate ABC transporter permease [Tepidisphaeraceae bacterium]
MSTIPTSKPETTIGTPPLQEGVALTAYAASAKSKRGRRLVFGRPLVHLVLIVICTGAIVPFLWMLATSLKTLEDAMAFPPTFIPRPFQWNNYSDVLTNPKANFLLWTRNTVIIATLAVIGTTLSSAVVAYGFAKIKFRGRGVMFAIMLATMMVPFPVTMVSIFSLFKWFGDVTGEPWLGTFKPLWLPAWFGSAFNIFLLRQFFITIPDELSEAARIDGCSEAGIFFRIILPLAKPALSVVALFAFMGIWNDFLGPLIYLQRPEQFTLALGLQNFQSQHGGTPWHQLMAASVLVVLPVLILFFVAQRTFIEGIATTGMKG